MLKKITLDKILNKLTNKKVFLRTDFNVPMKDGEIVDDFRIKSSFSSMNKILENKPKSLLIGSHLGRPNGQYNNVFSLRPVYEYLKNNFNSDIEFIDYPLDNDKVRELQNKEGIFLLENLRFNPEEEGKVKKSDGSKQKVDKENIQNFRQKLTQISDIYVNDAFGTMHRAHSSIVGVDVDLRVAGDLVQQELKNFGQILEHPENLGILLGGAKVADKIPVIKNLLEKSQNIMIGGAMAFTFLKVKNDIDIGDSLFEEKSRQKVEDILNLAERKNAKIHLPLDFVAGKDLKDENQEIKTYRCGDNVDAGWKGFDIGIETIKQYTEFIKECDQLVWNGPMGVFENQLFEKGSYELAKQIASRTQAKKLISIIGGGDTANLVEKVGLKDQFTHVSTGGGASLELMAGEELPGVKFLSSN